jgi:hypothetical protein
MNLAPAFDEAGHRSEASSDWIAAMRRGDFARAWEICDAEMTRVCAVSAKHEGPRHLQRIWRGEPFEGRRVLVRCYHGLGDTIQFARFLAPLRMIAGEVIVWTQPALLSLIANVRGVDRVLPLHDGTPQADFDVDMEIMEVAHAIRATREQVEMRRPYLRPASVDRCEGAITDDVVPIGLAWDVGSWDRRRVVYPELLGQLNQPGLQLYSLQRGSVAETVRTIGAIDISTPDLDILAGRLKKLTVSICPDTMIAHLSAALGCETWVMLHADCDWRWPACGSTTPWYPTMRLFRQNSPGDWRSVIEQIRSAIAGKLDRCQEGQQAPV